MTLRIIETRSSGSTVVSVHGWIEGDDEAGELLRIAREARAPVILDLEELRAAEPCGLAALLTLAHEGAELSRASDFITILLESAGHPSPASAGVSNGESS